MEDREALDAAQKTEQGKGACLLIWIINPTDIKNNFRVIDVDLFLIYIFCWSTVVSDAQQGDSVIQTHILLLKLFSIIDNYEIFTIVPYVYSKLLLPIALSIF